MFRRLALATLLIGSLAVSANAQKNTPKSTSLLTWETVAADKASKLTTKRAQVPGGWLVLVQNGDDLYLTFLPDAGHAWDDGSPSDKKPNKAGDTPKFEDTKKPVSEKTRFELLSEKLREQAERDHLNTRRQAGDERTRLLDQMEKATKDKKPKKGEKGDQAPDANKETERQRIAEALGLAARDESQKAKALADQARAAAVAEREKAEAVQKRLAATMISLEEARKAMGIAKASAEESRNVAEAARREALVLKEILGAVAKEFQKQLADTTKALDEARAAEKRARIQAEEATAETKRLQAELDFAKREAERLKALLDKKKKKK